MTHGSLFSGIGGFDIAAQWAGWENIFHCEINPFGQRILKYYWPNADSYEDIKQTDFTIYRGRIEVLSGGFPCQPFSLAGKRQGAEDDRYLWPEMLRAIDEIRPRWVIGENVAGLTSMVQPEVDETDLESQTNLQGEIDSKTIREYQQYVVETVCADLEHLGYSVQPIIVPACAIGAPHRRDRIWFIAYSNNKECNRRSGEGEQEWQATELGRNRILRAASRPSIQQSIANAGDTGIKGNEREKADGKHKHESVTDTTGSRLEIGRQTRIREHEEEAGKGMDHRSKQFCGDDAHPHIERLEGISITKFDNSEGWEKQRRCFEQPTSVIGGALPTEGWANFPTQPPVCSGDDGLSSRLDGITFPKWRAESIKAYGNAIVPQVAFEFFQHINTIENEQK